MVSVEIPTPSQNQLALANRAIKTSPPVRPSFSNLGEARRRVNRIYSKLRPAANTVCKYIGQDECRWKVSVQSDQIRNAYATGEEDIVIYQGMVDYSETDDQLAFVIAHEMSHHVANHMSESMGHQALGMLIMGAAAIYATRGPSANYSAKQELLDDSMKLGATIGSRVYSKQQEREADYLAVYILNNSGYDISDIKNLLITLEKGSRSNNYGLKRFIGSHPSGPERLAIADMVIEEIRKERRSMPKRRETKLFPNSITKLFKKESDDD